MQYVVFYDYAAIYIDIVVLASIIVGRLYKDKAGRRLALLFTAGAIDGILDVYSVSLDLVEGAVALKWAVNTIYVLFSNLMMPLYVLYMLSFVRTNRKTQIKEQLLGGLPLLSQVFLLLTNFWTKWIFYISDDGVYVRGRFFWTIYIGIIYYMMYSIVCIFRSRRLLGLSKAFSLISFTAAVIACVGIQFVYPEQLVQLFGGTLALLFMIMTVQKPEAYINHDTGAYNSMAFMDNLKKAHFWKEKQYIIIANIGNFQAFMDIMGVTKTLDIMKDTAERITAIGRGYTVYYLQRGLFRIIPNEYDEEKVVLLANKINEMFQQPLEYGELTLRYSECTCIAKYPEDAADPDAMAELCEDIGQGYYNGDVIWAGKVVTKDKYNLSRQMDTYINEALTNHRFEVYYQPIYSIKQKKFVSAEALLRMRKEDGSFISPDIFIPAAEKSGAIHAIGDYVLNEVCDFISSEQYKTLGLEYIEINLSVAQCMRSNLASDVMNIIKSKGVDVSSINLEITETAAGYSPDMLVKNMNKLTWQGIKFSLDDYGTGYSNVQRIASMPFSIMKIDKSFSNAERDSRMKTILENTVRMFKALSMEIVVEGVETKDVMGYFAELGCDFIQGYYFSKPLPKKDFIEFIESK